MASDNATIGLRLDDNEYNLTVAELRSLFGVVSERENKPTKEQQTCLVLRVELPPDTNR